MIDSPTVSTHSLWYQLTEELIYIYDAHHVCVAAAQVLAEYSKTATIVCLRSPLESHLDVWVCQPGNKPEQVRWDAWEDTLGSVVRGSTAARLPAAEYVGSPLESVVGAVTVMSPFFKSRFEMSQPGAIGFIDPGEFVRVDSAELQSIAHYMTAYLERAYLRNRTTQQEIVFDVVNDMSLALTSSLSLEDIYDKVANPIRRIINAESVSIGLYDADEREVVFVQRLLGPLFEDLPPIRLKEGEGIAGWVVRNKEPVLVNNVYDDQRFSQAADDVSGFTTTSLICVPLLVEGQLIGILEAINKQIGRFDKSDLDLMQAIASPLAIALENAKLHSDVLAEKRRVEAIFENMSEGMLTTDETGLVTGANDSLLSMLQVDSAEILGKPAQAVMQTRRHNFTEFVDAALSSEEEIPNLACDVFSEYSSDAVPVLISGASIRDRHHEVTEGIFVFSDLRAIREVERMRDDFFHNIVHELRTPLATILMYARLLKKGVKNEAKAQRFLDTIERESDRLQAMVRQMLALAKLEAREIQRSSSTVNVNKLLDEIVNPLADAARSKGLGFVREIRPNLPTLTADREILYSIFKNLIDNAVKFTHEGDVEVEAWAENGTLNVIIRDEGIGIPQEGMPNLFRRFYRAQTAVEHGIAGTGLGLYMVKEGIEKHRGTIEVSSEVGAGTQFTIALPVS